jgi:tocopherol cyclase
MLSAAAVPIIGHVINGVIAFLYYKGRIFRFAAYTGARITILQKENDILKLFITSPRYELRLLINSCNTALLIGPTLTSMNRDVKESINGSIKLELVKRGGEMIFKDESQRTSVELCGDIRKLI